MTTQGSAGGPSGDRDRKRPAPTIDLTATEVAGAMELMGPKGLFVYAAVVSLLLTGFVLVRIAQVRRPAAGRGFAIVVPTSSASAALTPRAEAGAPAAPPHQAEGRDGREASAVARAETSS